MTKCFIFLLNSLVAAHKMSPLMSLLTSYDDDSDDHNDCPSFVVGGTLGLGGNFEWKWHNNGKERMKMHKKMQR
jgi:hypothetical protein